MSGAAAVLGVLAAAAFLWTRGDEPAVEAAPVVVAAPGDPEAAVTPVRRYNAPSGIQTTVPDTLGYPERTAIYALENGGFRVRVMEHKVAALRDEGVVVQQLPRGGVTRRLGWIITIYVGKR